MLRLRLFVSVNIFAKVLATFTFSVLLSVAAAQSLQKTIRVNNSQQLYSALKQANTYGNTRIVLADGDYKASTTLQIKSDYITLSSASGNRDSVIITGRGMKSSRGVDNLIRVSGKHFTLDGITLQQASNHLIQIAGEQNADFPILRNCVLRDAFEQLLKVSYNHNTRVASDNGLIENCDFIYTAGIGPQYYIGGIDVHGGHNWTVRNNHFQNIASPEAKVAEHAIHFWNNTNNTLVEHNIIINCDRGIGFGMKNRPNMGGVIQNNLILHSDNHHPNADVGIIIEDSPNTKILNNKIYLAHAYNNAIEYRFKSTVDVKISGNLTNKPIRKREGASAVLANNSRSKNLDDYLTPEQATSLRRLFN